MRWRDRCCQNQVIAARLTRASVSPVPSVVFREALLVQPPAARSRETELGVQGAPTLKRLYFICPNPKCRKTVKFS